MFGSHLSIAGSLCNALKEAESLGLDTVQVFTKNQQQWKAPPLPDSAVREWNAEISRLGWQGRATAHASYLINLASPDDELWKKSIDLMRIEIDRCEALEIPFLIHHPGSHVGTGVEAGISRIAAAYAALFKATPGYRTVCCLENTAASGSNLGGPFEELAALRSRIIDTTGQAQRVGFCIDTCHAHAAGYDLSTRQGASEALDRLDALCGLTNIRSLHLNDSKGAVGSRLDRHAHIGEGTIGSPDLQNSGFTAVVNRPEFRSIPKILETPKGSTPAGTPYDTLNVRRLRKLALSEQPIKNGPPRPTADQTRPRKRQAHP